MLSSISCKFYFFILLLIISSLSQIYAADIPQTISLHRTIDRLDSPLLVTVGIPFAPGQLSTTDNIRVFDGDTELKVFAKPTLWWHFKSSPLNTIRAIKLQFEVEISNNTKIVQFTFDTKRSENYSISEQNLDPFFYPSTEPLKASIPTPKVLSILTPAWLANSQIVPPFEPMKSDRQSTFWQASFNGAKSLSFKDSDVANWLFDRPTALYKGCMRTGEVDCYLEAYLSMRYWLANLNTSANSRCYGGTTLSNESRLCDGKYIYIEPLKIYLALTGDDRFSGEEFVNRLAKTSWETGQALPVSMKYTQLNQWFTERGAGLTLLAQVSAYEITSSKLIYERIETSIDHLYEMQQNPIDGYPPDGSWRHSWDRHEGNSDRLTRDPDDRRFSPWMMENISDALWHAYFVIEDKRISKMLKDASWSLYMWGFADSPGYRNKFNKSMIDYREELEGRRGWNLGCNKGPLTLYSASSTASLDSLLKTSMADGWYSDAHNPESIFTLSVGYYFETDPEKSNLLNNLINDIADNFFNRDCGNINNPPRMFNWQNRSNQWGTYLWVKNHKN